MFIPIAFKPSDKVRIKEAEFDAVVNKVIIERGSIIYQVQWWVEKEWRTGDFYEDEIEEVEVNEKVEAAVVSVARNGSIRVDENHPLYQRLPRTENEV